LRECQEELNFLKTDVQSTFTQEEEKQHLLLRKVGDLESDLLDRNVILIFECYLNICRHK